ncbi:hypothetical protein ABIB50_001634 [Mucilaginibacter sp. UYCu711]
MKAIYIIVHCIVLKGSGSRTRTYDLRVMSPTSYQLLHPALFLLVLHNGHNPEMVFSITKKQFVPPFNWTAKI